MPVSCLWTHLKCSLFLKQHKALECLFPPPTPPEWKDKNLLGLESFGVGSESPGDRKGRTRGALPRAWMGRERGSSRALRVLRICARGCSCGWARRCPADEGHLDQAAEKSQGRKAEELRHLCKLKGFRLRETWCCGCLCCCDSGCWLGSCRLVIGSWLQERERRRVL